MKRFLLTSVIVIASSITLMSQDSKLTLTLKKDFNRIEVGNCFEATIEQSSANLAEIEYSSELEPFIIAKVSGSTLFLNLDTEKIRKSKNRKELEKRMPYFTLKAHIKLKELTELECSGVSKVGFEGKFKGENLKIDANGVSKINADKMEVETLGIEVSGVSECSIMNLVANLCKVDNSGGSKVRIKGTNNTLSAELSGSSNLSVECISPADKIEMDMSGATAAELSGKANVLNAELSGASKCNAKELSVENAYIECSGASKVSVNADKVLGLNLSGASSLSIPKTSVISTAISVSGASSIKQFD